MTSLAVACAASFSPMVRAKKMEPLHDTAGNASVSEPASPDHAVFSHRKLLQTAVAKTGAPVYRFVECRHLAKEESKLVQVGLATDGAPVYRVKRGDYCLFTGMPATPDGKLQISAASFVNRKTSKSLSAAEPPVLNSQNLGEGLSPVQQYVCEKFGPACQVALAVQLAENPSGACEVYHYNTSDGSLDWGYFQINSVHLKSTGLNLKNLLDCRANIDYAYQLFLQKGFAPWSAYTTGAYRQFLPSHEAVPSATPIAQNLSAFGVMTMRRIER